MSRDVRGLKELQRELNRAIRGIKGRTLEGVIDGRDEVSDATVPFTPFRTGVLRGSRTHADSGDPNNPQATIAFTAPYAVKVHEAVNLNFKVGGAKFLERPLYANAGNVLKAIERKARIR